MDGRQQLWNFAVALYGAPGVAPACLELQNAAEIDVPLLLCAAWLGSRGGVLTAEEIARLDAGIAAWREEVVRPLRAMRRRMKTGPEPAPAPATDALRELIKAAELRAERIELDLLEALAPQRCDAPPTRAVPRNLDLVLRHFSSSPPAGAGRAVATIVAALDV